MKPELLGTRSGNVVRPCEMATGIAHEINNPINFVFGGSQTLADIWAEVIELLELCDEMILAAEENRDLGPFLERIEDFKQTRPLNKYWVLNGIKSFKELN